MTYVALNISHFMSEVWRCFPDFCHGLLSGALSFIMRIWVDFGMQNQRPTGLSAPYVSGQTVRLTPEQIFRRDFFVNPGQRSIHERFPSSKEDPHPLARETNASSPRICLEVFRAQPRQIADPKNETIHDRMAQLLQQVKSQAGSSGTDRMQETEIGVETARLQQARQSVGQQHVAE